MAILLNLPSYKEETTPQSTVATSVNTTGSTNGYYFYFTVGGLDARAMATVLGSTRSKSEFILHFTNNMVYKTTIKQTTTLDKMYFDTSTSTVYILDESDDDILTVSALSDNINIGDINVTSVLPDTAVAIAEYDIINRCSLTTRLIFDTTVGTTTQYRRFWKLADPAASIIYAFSVDADIMSICTSLHDMKHQYAILNQHCGFSIYNGECEVRGHVDGVFDSFDIEVYQMADGSYEAYFKTSYPYSSGNTTINFNNYGTAAGIENATTTAPEGTIIASLSSAISSGTVKNLGT